VSAVTFVSEVDWYKYPLSGKNQNQSNPLKIKPSSKKLSRFLMKNQRLKSNINQLLLFRSSSVKNANPVKTKKVQFLLESPFLIPNPIETRSVL